MKYLHIKTRRLLITHFSEDMAESVHQNSLDADIKTFVPDEVFETKEDALNSIKFLMKCYNKKTGPFVYPVLLNGNENIGYVQTALLKNGSWEVGYHIAKKYTGNGYATEAVTAFLPVIMKRLNIGQIFGICRSDNIASRKVLEKCSFALINIAATNYHNEWHEVCSYVFSSSPVLPL